VVAGVVVLLLVASQVDAKSARITKLQAFEQALVSDIESDLEKDLEVSPAQPKSAEIDLETQMHGGGGTYHGPQGKEEMNTYALVILCTVFAIAILTVGFEQGEHSLKHHAKSFKPVVEALFAELTVGGFMALLAFVFGEVPLIYDSHHHKQPLLKILSIGIFPSDKGGSIVPHAFHEIHLIIFMNMVFLMISVVSGLGYIIYKCEQMRKFEEEATEIKLIQNVRGTPAKHSSAEAESYFHARERFIEANELNWDFDFHKYSTKKVCHTVAEMVEVPPLTWGFISLLALIVWGIRAAVPIDYKSNAPLVAIICLEYCVLAFTIGLSFYFRSVMRKLLPLPATGRTESLASDDAAPLKKRNGWDVPAYMAGYLGVQTTPCKVAHDKAFGIHHASHKIEIILTTTLVCGVAYISAQVSCLMPLLTSGKFDSGTAAALMVVSLLPIPFIQAFLFSNALHFATATSIEAYTDVELVRKQVRHQKTQTAISNLHILTTLKSAIGTLSAVKDGRMGPQKAVSTRRLHELSELFNLIDEDKSGEVSTDELLAFLTKVNGDGSEKDVGLVVSRMIPAGGNSVSFDAFSRVLGAFESPKMDPHDPKFIDLLFDMFDKDKSGDLNMGEVVGQLTALGAWNSREVTQLFLTMDTDDSGEVSKEEFTEFVQQVFASDGH
jgi:Ca2+-binding EF-hand superfamily protein